MSREVELPTVDDDDGQLIRPPLPRPLLYHSHWLIMCANVWRLGWSSLTVLFSSLSLSFLSLSLSHSLTTLLKAVVRNGLEATAESNGKGEFIRVDRQHCNGSCNCSALSYLSGHLVELQCRCEPHLHWPNVA